MNIFSQKVEDVLPISFIAPTIGAFPKAGCVTDKTAAVTTATKFCAAVRQTNLGVILEDLVSANRIGATMIQTVPMPAMK